MPLISALFLIFASCGRKYFSSDGVIWGTSYHIVYSGDRPLDDSIAGIMRQIDNELSIFNPMSEVSAVNACTSDSVGLHFRNVFAIAREVHRLSGGSYDVSVGPLAALWGFGPSGEHGSPDSAAIAEALDAVGLDSCRIAGGRVHKKRASTCFDFSSVAKGYGVKAIADMLARNGCTDFMVEVGGEVELQGKNPRGDRWRIQVDAPVGGNTHQRHSVLALGPERTAVASSGNYRNVRADSAGNVYGHTIDPVRGVPVQTDVLAATVVGTDCGFADALATACMTMTAADAIAMLEACEAPGMLIVSSGDTMTTVVTANFPVLE